MILAVSSERDEHAGAVLRALASRGAEARLLDLSDFPQRMQLTLAYGIHTVEGDEHGAPGRRALALTFADGTHLRAEECQAVWWRRPQSFELHPQVARRSHQHFALNECHEAWMGFWQSLPALWINDPQQDEQAQRKAYQLGVAGEIGLAVPHTLITNDPVAAREFIEAEGAAGTVYKAFSATEQEWRETRLVRLEELALLDNVRYAPVIFQEYIEARYDLRVTVVSDAIFPAAIHSQQTTYKYDFRMDMANAAVEAVELPAQVQEQLHSLMTRLGLVYGAIDMRLTPNGRYVFLEINPAGQWLFIETRTGQPITEQLAATLARGGTTERRDVKG